jgi:hypothetical protein
MGKGTVTGLEGQDHSNCSQCCTEDCHNLAGIKSDNPLHWIYSPKLVDPTKTVRKQDDNIEGLQYLHLHPLLLDSPWEEPVILDDLLIWLCSERDPITYGQASSKNQPRGGFTRLPTLGFLFLSWLGLRLGFVLSSPRVKIFVILVRVVNLYYNIRSSYTASQHATKQ